jgi:hypothetical protein
MMQILSLHIWLYIDYYLKWHGQWWHGFSMQLSNDYILNNIQQLMYGWRMTPCNDMDNIDMVVQSDCEMIGIWRSSWELLENDWCMMTWVMLTTYLPTYLFTHVSTHPSTYLPTYPLTHPPTYLPTHSPTYLPPITNLPTNLLTYPPTYLPTYPPTSCNSPTYLLFPISYNLPTSYLGMLFHEYVRMNINKEKYFKYIPSKLVGIIFDGYFWHESIFFHIIKIPTWHSMVPI